MDKTLLNAIVNGTEKKASRVFTLVIHGLILLSAILFSIETLPGLSTRTRHILYAADVVTVLIFTAEYALRVYVSPRRAAFIFSFFGVLDLLSFLPFYLGTGIDLRAIRIFRLLRLFRIFKLPHFRRAINRFGRAMVMIREELVLFFCSAMLVMYLSAVGIYFFEHAAQPDKFKSVFHSLWWSLSTLTTVGYGDIYPITAGGRIFTFFVLMAGLGIIAVPAGLFASALAKARQEEDTQKSDPAAAEKK
ncbi:MAG: ion transporter [Planctomycetes bacterium]|nr:ion transporter [Planctomycetota bacterium]